LPVYGEWSTWRVGGPAKKASASRPAATVLKQWEKHRHGEETHDRNRPETAHGVAAGAPLAPLQLRRIAATLIREKYGVEAAKTVLGHTRIEITQIYAERDLGKAREIMGEIG
jgi:hypothetical protein